MKKKDNLFEIFLHMNKWYIAGTLTLCVILFLFIHLITYNMASSICVDKELKPFRYESIGLFGTLTKIETTEENADGYSMFCIRTGEPEFWKMSENLEFILEQTKKNSEGK